jgi:hypothetical protein
LHVSTNAVELSNLHSLNHNTMNAPTCADERNQLTREEMHLLDVMCAVRTAIFFGAFTSLVVIVFYDDGRFLRMLIEALSCVLYS